MQVTSFLEQILRRTNLKSECSFVHFQNAKLSMQCSLIHCILIMEIGVAISFRIVIKNYFNYTNPVYFSCGPSLHQLLLVDC